MIIADMTMPEFEAGLNLCRSVVIPFGSVEQHGLHLPLGTDTLEAADVAQQAAGLIPLFVAPAVAYGNCCSTACHPGTISVSVGTVRSLFLDIGTSLVTQGFRDIIALTGHAGNAHRIALREAGEELLQRFDHIQVAVVSEFDLAGEEGRDIIETPWDSHAGEIETSRILYRYPHLVKGTSPAEKPVFPLGILVRDKRSYWPGGVWGDPAKATADKGRQLEDLLARKLADLVIRMQKQRHGC